MNRMPTFFAVCLGIFGLLGCGILDDSTPDDSAEPVGAYRTTGLALTSDALADTDIEAMEFSVQQVKCRAGSAIGSPVVKSTDYEDMYLPGGIGKFEDRPYDADSQHMFADQYFVLDKGCYNVTTQPLRSNGHASRDCKPAHKNKVRVRDGKTTEILLINQCKGAKRGGLDVLGSINHPPEIDDLVFKDSKFVAQCRPKTKVCVTASDPDDDPLEFSWSGLKSAPKFGSIQSHGQPTTDPQTGQTTACAKVATNQKGEYAFRVRVFDLDGNGTRIEKLLQQQGPPVPAKRSRDVLSFPMYAGKACQGRSAIALLSFTNSPGPGALFSKRFIRQTSQWVSPISDPANANVLLIEDDNDPQNEHPGEDLLIRSHLDAVFPNVSFMLEPSSGLSPGDLDNYDVVWFFNAGWPMDDPSSYDELQRFLATGGGFVLSGDDMAGPDLTGGRSLSYFSHLDYMDNGVSTCGDTTNGNVGNNYKVKFANRSISALNGLRNKTFKYGNDIDHTVRQNSGERMLATATYVGNKCRKSYPAAVSIDSIDLP